MSVYPRIDPNHPLTRAAREVNAIAELNGLEQTLRMIGLDVELGQYAYLAEQRALRALAASEGINLGEPGTENWKPAVSQLPDLVTLTSAYMDGIAIGFKAAALQTERHP